MAQWEIGYVTESRSGGIHKVVVEANHIEEARQKVLDDNSDAVKIETSKRA